eukprot:16515-Heterococcus_DN1.PRE.3
MAKRVQLHWVVADTPSMQLLRTGVLDLVLSFVGRGHHLFISAVSKEWRDRYKNVSTVNFIMMNHCLFEHMWCETVTSEKTTFCSAAFASSTRVRMLAVRPPLVHVCFRQQASMRTTGQRCSCPCGKSRLEVVSLKCQSINCTSR